MSMNNGNTLKIPYALNVATGRLAHVDSVPNGLQASCVCPSCGTSVLAKQGNIKAHHFAHYVQSQSCEGWLHDAAKKALHQRQQDALAEGASIRMVWECDHCECKHTGDLLRKTATVQLEKVVSDGGVRIKPDLTAFGCDGQYTNFQEVVDTHSPEEATHQLAEARGIPLLAFHVEQPEDIEALLANDLNPKVSNVPCFGRKCSQCGVCRDCPSKTDHHTCAVCRECVDVPSSNHWFCEACGKCVEGAHRHCQKCNQGYSPLRPESPSHLCHECWMTKEYPPCQHCGSTAERDRGANHEYCVKCSQCFEWRSDFGQPPHRHCRLCGLVWETNSEYPSHYCCWVAQKYGVPLCPAEDRNNGNHRHCTDCSKRVNRKNRVGEFFEMCWECHQMARQEQQQQGQTQRQSQGELKCNSHCQQFYQVFGHYPRSHDSHTL